MTTRDTPSARAVTRRGLIRSGIAAIAAPAVLRVVPVNAQSRAIKIGHVSPKTGPLENADLVGTDLTLAIHKTVLPDLERRGGPSPYLEALVAQGRLGFKSGAGFREWSGEQQAALRAKVLQHLKKARDA